MKGDTFGWSPDVGEFVRRDGKVYTEYGHVIDEATSAFRVGFGNPVPKENYADWSDEKRGQVCAYWQAFSAAREAEEKEQHEKRLKFVESAKAKLTPEEWEALRVEFYE